MRDSSVLNHSQEWNEIQFNGVFYSPPLGPGEPGVLDAEHSYTFKYPRPNRRAADPWMMC